MTVNGKTKLFTVAILLALVLSMVLSIAPTLACGDCGPGTGTPGYYKKPEHWPEGVTEIEIGGILYPMGEAIGWLNTPAKGDKSITLFKALVAAKLNVLAGNCHDCIDDTIADADGPWMRDCGPVGSSVRGSSDCWQYSHGEALYLMLDDYNNGRLCAPPRD
jgi:hypothetical protein